MSASIDDTESSELETIIDTFNKEIEEVGLCIGTVEEINYTDPESKKAIQEEDAEKDDDSYILYDGENVYLTINSNESESTTRTAKTRSAGVLKTRQSRQNVKITKSSSTACSGEVYMVDINDGAVELASKQDVDDPKHIETKDEIYDFDEAEEEAAPLEEDAHEVLIQKVIRLPPKKNNDSSETYCCTHCNYKTVKRYLLSRHLKAHSDDRPYKCSVCERGFKTNSALQNHLNVHLGKKPHGCMSCESRFTTAGELSRHVRYMHTHEKRHKCSECDYATVEMSKLRRHMRAHTGERPFQCPHCTYASPDSFKLKRHLRIHTGEKPYECDICLSRFTQSNSLKTHKLIHSVDDKPLFQCSLCTTTCGRKSDLRIHVQKLHYSDKPIPCKRCGRELPDRYSYKMHIKTHEGERCYSCDVCSYASISLRNLEIHKQIHSDEKPFACQYCTQTFRQKQLLGRHINLYHNTSYVPPPKREKVHKCPYCCRAFANKGNMLRHMQLHDVACKKSQLEDDVDTVEDNKLLSLEDSCKTDDDTTNVDNFEQYEILEDPDNDHPSIQPVKPSTSSKISRDRKNLNSTRRLQAKLTEAKKDIGSNYTIQMETKDLATIADDETDLQEYMVVKVLESDDDLDDDEGCVILTEIDDSNGIEMVNIKPESNVGNCFGFNYEDGKDAEGDTEETVLFDIIEED